MHRTLIILLIFIASCRTKPAAPIVKNNHFTLPYILQKENPDTVEAVEADGVSGAYPPMIGRFKFGDTINFNKLVYHPMFEQDYLWEVQNARNSDSFSSDGLQIIPDYKTSITYAKYDRRNELYYPVYIVNETDETKIFFAKDSHGFAIQEAIDTSDHGRWHPIEAEGGDFCGNGRWRKKIKPGEFLVFLLPKYAGSCTTSLRIRFKVGESIFVSKAFDGIINPKQFNIEKDNLVYDDLKRSNGGAAGYLFYGAIPKGKWD